MTWVLRDQIDLGNVGKIIDAVRHGYKRRKVKIPADIDGLSLRRDIDRAIAGYRAFVDTSPKQPQKERSDHLRRQIREIEDLIDSIEGDGPAAWVRNQIARRGHDEKPLAPPVIGHLRSFMGQLRRLQSDASGAKLDLGDSPESALQWLVGGVGGHLREALSDQAQGGQVKPQHQPERHRAPLPYRQPIYRLRHRRLQGSWHLPNQPPYRR